MELGIEQQLINYALGVNAFADKRYDLAENYLNSAREMDLETYGEKVDSFNTKLDLYYNYFEVGLRSLTSSGQGIKVYSCSPNSRLNQIISYKDVRNFLS